MNAVTAIEAAGEMPGKRWHSPRPAGSSLRDPTPAELGHIPGRRGLPYLGVMPEAVADPMRFARCMVAKYGPVYRFYALGRWHVHAAGAEANEKILFDEDGIFSAAEGWGPLVGSLFPGALIAMDGSEHRISRRLLGEAFKQANISGYQRIFSRDIEAAVQEWSGRTIDSYQEIKRLTFSISASTFLGVSLEQEAEPAISYFATMMRGLLTIVKSERLSFVRRRGQHARVRLEEILARLIREKRARPGDDFLSKIAHLRGDDGELLPVQQITDSFIFLLTASHDTLASGLTSSLYYLAAYPEWAARLRAELAEHQIANSIDAASARLPLQEMFFKEVLRLNGPAPVIWRRAVRSFSVRGMHIPAGTMVGANLMMTHRLPDIWENPLVFDPYRFSPAEELKRSRHAYAPFSGGVHKCLGLHFSNQQARIFITHILQNTDLELPPQRPVSWYHWPNCRPRGACYIDVNPRYRGR